MIIETIAHVLALFITPTVGAISYLLLPVIANALDLEADSRIEMVSLFTFCSLLSSFVSFWFATVIFSWMNIEPGLPLFLILAIGFAFNDVKRIQRGTNVDLEIGSLIGDLCGILVGAMLLTDIF
ncbi:MAG: hypothetical protein WC045_04040 [Patescibacteria group bacterium]